MEKQLTPDRCRAQGAVFEEHRAKSIRFLQAAVACVGFTMTLQVAVNSNFVVQEMHLTGLEQGILEMFRESCGIFALGILALAAGFAEPVIGAWALLLVGIGLGSYVWVHNYFWLVALSLIWSQGLHIWMPLPNSMGLALAEPGSEGRTLGKIQAAAAAGSGLGLLCALVMTFAGAGIRPLYLLAGATAVTGCLACIYIPRNIRSEKPRLVFRKEYGLYYLLNFLEGWRKQIFLAFSGFLLVSLYQTSLSTMLLMWMATQAIGWFTSPAVGRLIDRIGERKVLVFYYSFMTLCFIGYAFLRQKYLLYAVFLLDSAFFVFAMALTTYIGKLTPVNEKTMTLSMGVAFNHIASVAMPLVGGLAWKYLGYRWTFLIGACAAGASIFAALLVPRKVTRFSEASRAGVVNSGVLAGGEPQ